MGSELCKLLLVWLSPIHDWLPSKVKCHSKPHGLKACATKSRVHPDLQIYLKQDTPQNRSRKIMRTRWSLIHIYWTCPGLQHFMMDNCFLPGSQLLRMHLLLITQTTQARCSTGSNGCLEKKNTTSQLHPKHTQILLTLSGEPRWIQVWLVLPWTSSLELKRYCQAATPNGSICDFIASH